jgi:hypothetical protein
LGYTHWALASDLMPGSPKLALPSIIDWHSSKDTPDTDKPVLTFCPNFPEDSKVVTFSHSGLAQRYFKINQIPHWAYMDDIKSDCKAFYLAKNAKHRDVTNEPQSNDDCPLEEMQDQDCCDSRRFESPGGKLTGLRVCPKDYGRCQSSNR